MLVALIAGIPWILGVLNTVSTDDAYVNGHVTFVAPRVPGQVMRVFVDNNNRVHKGDMLVRLDKVPYEVQVAIARSAVESAQSDLVVAQSEARATEGRRNFEVCGLRLERSIEDVDNQVALLRARAATLDSQKASLAKAQADYDRALPLVKSGAVSKEDIDTRNAALLVAKAQYEQALQGVYQTRVAACRAAAKTRKPATISRRFRPIWIRLFRWSARPRQA